MDCKIKLETGKEVSLMGMRIICTDVECDLATLSQKFDLTDDERMELNNIILAMFKM